MSDVVYGLQKGKGGKKKVCASIHKGVAAVLAMRPNTVLWCEVLRRAPSPSKKKKSPCLIVLGSEGETEALSPQ